MGDLSSALPLEGLTVVALEQAVAAPFATRQLADQGARVIKIERPGVGDFSRGYDTAVKGLASYFVWVNRSKESLSLDLKHAIAPDVLHRLLLNADVFIHNLGLGAVDRLGLGAEVVKERYPQLITCAISGYGSTGPYRNRRAYDLLIQAESGLMSVTGTEETPSRAGISIADIAGGMYALSGILTALFARSRTGRGTWMEVSLLEALGEWMSFPAYYTRYGGGPPPRTGAGHGTIAPYGSFKVGDGGSVYLAIQNEREWRRLCAEVLELPDLGSDSRFDSNPKRSEMKAELQAIIEQVFARCSLSEVERRLDEAKIAWAHLNTAAEFVDHPQLAARDRWRDVVSPGGPISMMLPPVTVEGVEPAMGPIPRVGQHTDEILTELGFSPETIAELHKTGAV
ncbi:MAG: CaiB/BaiF CoA-transferase family protein [Gemmatimonadota bacterium]